MSEVDKIHPLDRYPLFDELDDESDEAALRLVVECLIHLFEGYLCVCCPAVGIDDAISVALRY